MYSKEIFAIYAFSVTDTTGHGVVIFPLSSVAFMIVPLNQILEENQGQYLMNQEIIER